MDGWYFVTPCLCSCSSLPFSPYLCVLCLSLCILSLFCAPPPPPVLTTLMGCICPPGSLPSPVYLQDSVFPSVFDSSFLYIVWSVGSCLPLWTDAFFPLCRSIFSFSLIYLFRLLGHFVPCRLLGFWVSLYFWGWFFFFCDSHAFPRKCPSI